VPRHGASLISRANLRKCRRVIPQGGTTLRYRCRRPHTSQGRRRMRDPNPSRPR
jgi:hypothetical protein